MPRCIAFLRAINVGGHTVKMDVLRRHFQSLGYSEVETFIASGNVIFTTPRRQLAALEAEIAGRLEAALGYAVATFIRTEAELADLAAYQPFPPAVFQAAEAFNVAFLARPLDAPAERRLTALKNEIDDFAWRGREVYWLCRLRQSDSKFSNAVLEKTIGQPATLRGINTLQKLSAKLAAAA